MDFSNNLSRVTAHTGTGFLVGKNIIVTCWHCVRAELKQNEQYVAIRPSITGWEDVSVLADIEQDHNGSDLATARVKFEQEYKLSLTEAAGTLGTNVWSFGYPLTHVEQHPDPEFDKLFTPNPRYMESYVMRAFHYDQPGFGRTFSYELDMPALEGMSGAPIIRTRTKEILGVIYGRNDVQTIEEFSSRDPDTGAILRPEVVRMTYFALAHHNTTLDALKSTVTQELPLRQFLRS
jgi:hypothetical protein